MSEVVDIKQKLENSLIVQVHPEIERLRKELFNNEKHSFNTEYLRNIKNSLDTVLTLREFLSEAISNEEHSYKNSLLLNSTVSNYFGISAVNSTRVFTHDISNIDISDPLPPTYDGPPSTLTSVSIVDGLKVVWEERELANIIANVVVAGTTEIYTGHPTSLETGDIVKTEFTGDTEFEVNKITQNKISIGVEIHEDMTNSRLFKKTEVVSEIPNINITWDTNVSFIGYNLFRNGNLIATIDDGTISSHLDTSVELGTTYSYTISAIDSLFGDLPLSNPLSISTPEPIVIGVPSLTGLILESEQKVKLDWESLGTIGVDVDTYFIYRNGVEVFSTSEDITSWTDTNMPLNSELTYYMNATHPTGIRSDNSNLVILTVDFTTLVRTPIPRQIAINSNGVDVRLVWENGGSTRDVKFNVYQDDVKIASEILGSRTSDPDRWLTYYLVNMTLEEVANPHIFHITSTFEGNESEKSEGFGINNIIDPADIKLFINGEASSSIPQTGITTPINGKFLIEASYHGNSDLITSANLIMDSQYFSCSPINLTKTVSNLSNYTIVDTLISTSELSEEPGYIIGSVSYYDLGGQKLADRQYTIPIAEKDYISSPTGFFTESVIKTGDSFVKVSGVDAYTSFNIGDDISIDQYLVKTIVNILPQNPDNITIFFSEYNGNVISSGAEVINNSVTSVPVSINVSTKNIVETGSFEFLVIGADVELLLKSNDKFVFESEQNTELTVLDVLHTNTPNEYLITLRNQYTGTQIPVNTKLIIS